MAQAASGLSDAPTREQFVRRGTARATVLGNYVYVDGGEISQLGDDGKIAGRTSNQGAQKEPRYLFDLVLGS